MTWIMLALLLRLSPLQLSPHAGPGMSPKAMAVSPINVAPNGATVIDPDG
ncbi:MAG TPA: hypothetical protein VKY89_15405 [Thermoanaerobaculia bacterium]|jgi:hypothetical protein|nr:hypothetical protein [Thermoanaerobaculia bacterium]